MSRAAFLAAFSALLGGAIALLARKHPAVLERTRTFAFAAAAGVVAFHLLPEVLPQLGLPALLYIGAGFGLPWLLEAGARVLGPGLLKGSGFSTLRVAAEVGFAALLFHSLAEGLALVAALAQPRGQLDLEIALVAHHAPLTAAVTLPFLDLKGGRSVAVRAGLIAVAGVSGVLLSAVLPGFSEGAFLQKATAVTAGALLHVVSDEIRVQRFASPWERLADLLACVGGLAVAGLGAVLHLRESPEAAQVLEFLHAAAGFALAGAPGLLGGLVVASAVLLRVKGRGSAVLDRVARLDALALCALLLRPPAALALLGLEMLLVLPIVRVAAEAPAQPGFFEAVRQRAPRVLTLLIVAAAFEVGGGQLPLGPLGSAALLAALALAARFDDAGGVLVAAALIHRGLHPALAIAALALGATSRAAQALWARDRRRAALTSAGMTAAVLCAALLLQFSGVLQFTRLATRQALLHARDSLPGQVHAAPLGAVAAAVLIALALGTLWSAGVRGWFAPLRHGRS